MSPSERRIIIALLALGVAGQGTRLFLDRTSPPGEAFLPPGQRGSIAAHREASLQVEAPLRPGERLDPDQASARDLARLPGIGMRLAKQIVSDRELRGPFGSVQGLTRVDGIGPGTVRRLEPFLRFQQAPAAADPVSPLPNLNTMTAPDLERLPGVGPARARAILAYRDKNGPFADPHELDRVPGLTHSLARRLAGLVTVR